MSDSYKLTLTADTTKYQQELAKIPTVTDTAAKQAAAKLIAAQTTAQQGMSNAAKQAAEDIAAAQASLAASTSEVGKQAAEDLMEASKQAQNLTDHADKAGDAFGSFGDKAGKLGPLLEAMGFEGASALGDIADVGEGAAGTIKEITELLAGSGVSAGAAATAVVGLAVTVSALAAGYSYVNNQISTDTALLTENNLKMYEGEAAAKALAEALDAVAEAREGTSDTLKDAANQIALLRGEVKDYELAAQEAYQSVLEGAAAGIAANQQALSLASQQLAAAKQNAEAEGLTAEQRAEAYKAINALTPQVKALTEQQQGLVVATEQQAAELSNLILQEGRQAEADKAAEEASRKAQEAAKKYAATIKELAAAQAQLASIEHRAWLAQQTDSTKRKTALQEELDKILALEQVSGDHAAAEEARSEVLQAYHLQEDRLYQAALDTIRDSTYSFTEYTKTKEQLLEQQKQASLDQAAHERAVALELALTQEEITAVYAAEADKRAAIVAQYYAKLAKLEGEAAGKDQSSDTPLLDAANEHAQLLQASINERTEQIWQTLTGLDKAQRDVIADIGSGVFEAASSYQDAITSMITATEERLESQGGNMTEAQRQQLEKRLEAQKKAALVGFRITQATESTQAVMSAISSGIAASASVFETVPYPANLVLAPATGVAVVGAGIAQAAAILSQSPPSFRMGGEVPYNAPRLPGGFSDQRLVSAEPGERFFNKQESQQIERLLHSQGKAVVIQQVRRGRVIAEDMIYAVNNSSKARAALTAVGKPTRRNFYTG